MASSTFLCASLLVFFLLLHPTTPSVGDILSPILSPVFDDVCKEVNCGKGTCKPSSNSTFFFECECQPGWKQTASGQGDPPKYLPCVLPNCTLNYSCSKAPPPVQDKATKSDQSIFDLCFWSSCGRGSCNATSKFTYDCKCPAGYYNLLNISSFPCLQSCEIGMDCKNVGISSSNQSSSTQGTTNDAASSITQGHSLWLIIATLFVSMVLSEHKW